MLPSAFWLRLRAHGLLVPSLVSAFALGACGISEAPSDDDGSLYVGDGIGGTYGDGDMTSTGGTSGLGAGGTFTSGAGGGPIAFEGPSNVAVVAHQDDDLLFINPDLKRALARSEPLTTLYLTSGNAGMGMDYVEERERGIRSAYAFMAGASNSWTCSPQSHGNKSITTCVLNGEQDVWLVFFRLVDGFADGGQPTSLRKLWEGNVASSAAVDGSGLSFTREELIVSISEIFKTRAASAVYTTDFSFENRANDHSDHENAALFALAASGRHNRAHTLSSYLTYGTKDMPQNLSESDAAVVEDTFSFYASCDKELPGCSGGAGCDSMTCSTSSELYQSWYTRHYSFTRVSGQLSSQITSTEFAGECVNAIGTNVTRGSCSAGTLWSLGLDYTLKNEAGLCLTAPLLNTGANAFLSTCNGSSHQRWFMMDSGQIILGANPEVSENGFFNLAKCLSGGTAGNPQVTVNDCGPSAAVAFLF